MPPMPRYHPAQVVLHWLSAVLVVLALAMGMFILTRIPNAETAHKLFVLKWHMGIGFAIAFVLMLRIALRLALEQPARATSGNALLDRLAPLVHAALYIAVLGMAASGLALAVQSGLPAIVFGDVAVPLPADFRDYAPRVVHGVIAKALVGLVALHTAAALYHHFVRRDGLLRRMWFGAHSS